MHLLTPEAVLHGNLGLATAPSDPRVWLALPEHRLYELTCGTLFHEPQPLLTPALATFRYHLPKVRLKRLQAAWFMLMATGQGLRSATRDDLPLTRLAAANASVAAMRLCFLLSQRYAPCGKWLGRAFSTLPDVPQLLRDRLDALSSWQSPQDKSIRHDWSS